MIFKGTKSKKYKNIKNWSESFQNLISSCAINIIRKKIAPPPKKSKIWTEKIYINGEITVLEKNVTFFFFNRLIGQKQLILEKNTRTSFL